MIDDVTPEQVAKARQIILAELARRRIVPTIEMGQNGEEIRLENGVGFTVESFAYRIQHAAPTEWEDMAKNLIDVNLQLMERPKLAERPKDEILSRMRTRLIPGSADNRERFGYYREFAGNLIQIVCEDMPDAVSLLTTSQITEIPIPIDELFQAGQANTDAEPLESLTEYENGIFAIEGGSVYTAAKAANMGLLIKQTIGQAPAGVVFIIPNRSLMVFTTADPADPIDALVSITQVMDNIWHNPEFFHPGGFISDLIYYWSPEDTVEVVGGPVEKDGEINLTIVPTETYLKYCPLDEG